MCLETVWILSTNWTIISDIVWADDLDVGKILIAALTNFIIPLIEGNTMAPGERIDIPPTNISKSQYFSVGIGPDTS